MSQDDVMLQTVRNEGAQWIGEVSFRGKTYVMTFGLGTDGRLLDDETSPFHLTCEGREVHAFVERMRGGETLALPHRVEPRQLRPRLPSARSTGFDAPGLADVWVETAEQASDDRWVAWLRLDGKAEIYELEILPGPTLRELRGPKLPAFYSYRHDLMRLLLRMQNGERFALPFELRPRWLVSVPLTTGRA